MRASADGDQSDSSRRGSTPGWSDTREVSRTWVPSSAARWAAEYRSRACRKEEGHGSLQNLRAQGAGSRSVRARLVGQLSRQARQPGSMGELRGALEGE